MEKKTVIDKRNNYHLLQLRHAAISGFFLFVFAFLVGLGFSPLALYSYTSWRKEAEPT